MHISIELAGGFHWKRFKFIVDGDDSLHNVEVPVKIQSCGSWPFKRYEVVLPDEIPFEEATFVTARLCEVIRQAKSPSFFQRKRAHQIIMSFSYEETDQGFVMEGDRDIQWDRVRAIQAFESFSGWWSERTGVRSTIQTFNMLDGHNMIDEPRSMVVANEVTPSTTARWTITDLGVEIVMVGTNVETMEMLVGHITQLLSGSVWSGEKYQD